MKRVADAIYVTVAVLVLFSMSYTVLGPELRGFLAASTVEQEAGVLFGTATVALTTVGIILALVGFFGWNSIQRTVQAQVRSSMRAERAYDQALAQMTQGIIYSSLYQHTDGPSILRDMGITQCRKALASEALRGRRAEFVCKNNLAYLLAAQEDHPEDGRLALRLIEQIKDAWDVEEDEEQFLATQGLVLARFGRLTDGVSRGELVETREKLWSLEQRRAVTDYRSAEISHAREQLDITLADWSEPSSPPPQPSEPPRKEGLISRLRRFFRGG